jgi:hypothetical protein
MIIAAAKMSFKRLSIFTLLSLCLGIVARKTLRLHLRFPQSIYRPIYRPGRGIEKGELRRAYMVLLCYDGHMADVPSARCTNGHGLGHGAGSTPASKDRLWAKTGHGALNREGSRSAGRKPAALLSKGRATAARPRPARGCGAA